MPILVCMASLIVNFQVKARVSKTETSVYWQCIDVSGWFCKYDLTCLNMGISVGIHLVIKESQRKVLKKVRNINFFLVPFGTYWGCLKQTNISDARTALKDCAALSSLGLLVDCQLVLGAGDLEDSP